MRNTITYLFIFIYATVMLKPLMPFVSDMVAHTFWKYEHISTVHFENGKYHTHFESLEAAKKNDPVKSQRLADNNFSAEAHLMPASFVYPVLPPLQPVYFPNILFSIPASYPQTYLRPPQA